MRPSTLLPVLRKPEGLRKGTGASLRMAVWWPEGSGLTTVVNWADLAPVPWAALGEALVWVLKQELRLEICIGSHLAGAGREEHDFLFGILDQDTVVAEPLFTWRAGLAQLRRGHWANLLSSSQAWAAPCQARG